MMNIFTVFWLNKCRNEIGCLENRKHCGAKSKLAHIISVDYEEKDFYIKYLLRSSHTDPASSHKRLLLKF